MPEPAPSPILNLPHERPLRVVIPMVSGIGNALLAVPMVRQLKRHLPDCQISVIARLRPMADVLGRLPEVSQVLVSGGGLKGHLRCATWGRRLRPHLYLVPFPSNRWQYSVLAKFSGAPCVAMHAYPVGHWRALHGLVPRLLPAQRGLHDIVQNLRLLTLLGAQPDYGDSPIFEPTEPERLAAQKRLTAAGLSPQERPMIVHAGSGQTVVGRAKRWPTEQYAKLIALLMRERPEPIVLVEGPDERGVAVEIADAAVACGAAQRPAVIALDGPLGEAAALLQRAGLYVGSDSGLAHVAAAVGTRAVTLFAPADPDRVCPYGQRDLVVQPPRSCAPCLLYPWHSPYPKTRCTPPYCIGDIGVESVRAAIQRALSGKPGVPGTPAPPQSPLATHSAPAHAAP